MEKFHENTSQTEIMPLDQARFTDSLDSRHEETWTQLQTAIREGDLRHVETYGVLWNNHSIPQVFRDRALLQIANLDARQQVSAAPFGFLENQFVSNIKHNHLTTDTYGWRIDMEHIASWLLELSVYDRTHDVNSIDQSARLVWTYVLYEHKHLTDEEFDRLIADLDPAESSPTVEDYNRDDYDSLGYSNRLSNRINYLDHIFQGETVTEDMGRVKAWAFDKLNAWMAHYDNEDELPRWLHGVDKGTALSLIKPLLKLRNYRRDNKEWHIPLDTLRHARQLYSWKELLSDDQLYRPDTQYLEYGPSLLKALSGQTDLEYDLVSFLIQSREPYTGDAAYLLRVAQRLGDEKMIKRVEAIEKKQREEKARQAKERKSRTTYSSLNLSISADKEKLERLRRETKQAEERIAGKQAYEGLLAIIEQAHNLTGESDGTTE